MKNKEMLVKDTKEDMNLWAMQMKKILNQTYKPSFYSRAEDVFDKILITILWIFQPLNLLIMILGLIVILLIK